MSNATDIAALLKKNPVNQPGKNIWGGAPTAVVPRTQPMTPPTPAPAPTPAAPTPPVASGGTPAPTPAPAPAPGTPDYNLNGGRGAGTLQYDAKGNVIGFTPAATNNNNGTPTQQDPTAPLPANPNNTTPNNPDGAAPGSEQAAIDARRTEEQGTIDAISKQFDAVLSGDQSQKDQDVSAANAQAVAMGLAGSPSGGDIINGAQTKNNKQIATDQASKASAIAQILQTIDQQAITDYRSDTATAKTDAQTAINQLAQSGVSLAAFKAADPTRYQQLLTQSGMDDAQATFYWNAQQKTANQIQWQAPQKTNSGYLFYGVDPTTGQVVTQNVAADVGNYTLKITNDGSLLRYDASGNVQQYKNGQWTTPDQDNFGAAPSATKIVKDAAGNSYSYDANTGQLTSLTGSDGGTGDGSDGNVGSADLSSYDPSNPNYPTEIAGIVSKIGTVNSAADLQSYIDSNYSGSPITGQMIWDAAQKTGSDPATILAILQAESSVGTDPQAVTDMQRNDPGSIMGNGDGTQTKYNSLQDGVTGIGQWLADHPASASSGSGLSAADQAQAQSYADDITNGTITSIASVPKQYKDAVSTLLDNATSFSPLADSRFTNAANKIVANYIALPQYTLTANGLPYLQRIQAAMQNPGSISDQDLLDSLTKLNTAGNAISDEQVRLITGGQSFADMVSTFTNKFANGGVLSDNQRQQIQSLAQAIYANYAKGYQPVYDQVTSQLKASGIPKQFWTIPDLNNLSAQASGSGSGSGTPIDPSAVSAGDVIEVDGQQYTVGSDGQTLTPVQ